MSLNILLRYTLYIAYIYLIYSLYISRAVGWQPTWEHPDRQTNKQTDRHSNSKPGPPQPNASRSKIRHSVPPPPRFDIVFIMFRYQYTKTQPPHLSSVARRSEHTAGKL